MYGVLCNVYLGVLFLYLLLVLPILWMRGNASKVLRNVIAYIIFRFILWCLPQLAQWLVIALRLAINVSNKQ